MTPLLEAPVLAERWGVAAVHLKLDSLCPTGSFKDRAVVAGLAHAVSSGISGLVCASSGNAAASTAAYAARAGLPAVLVMPEITPLGKLAASSAYGATQILVPGDYSNSFAVAEELAERLGYVNVTTTYINPYAVTGLRSVAYDLAEQAEPSPSVVVVPTSAGPLVHGVATGFDDLLAWGRVSHMPRIVAAQPTGCSPVTRAFERGDDHVSEWEFVDTTVSGLDDPLRGYASDGTITLDALRRTGGSAHAIPDAEVDEARRMLACDLGVFVEPAAATSVAALAHLAANDRLEGADRVVCLLTGHGMKRPPTDAAAPFHASDVAAAVAAMEAVA